MSSDEDLLIMREIDGGDHGVCTLFVSMSNSIYFDECATITCINRVAKNMS